MQLRFQRAQLGITALPHCWWAHRRHRHDPTLRQHPDKTRPQTSQQEKNPASDHAGRRWYVV